MIYISLLLDAVSVILSLSIINFLYKIYIELRGNEELEEEIDNELPVEMENIIEDNEIIYEKPKKMDLAVDESFNEGLVKLIEEPFEIEDPKILEQEDVDEPVSEIKNDEEIVFEHSSFYEDDLNFEADIPTSRRRRLALKLGRINNNQ